jgi:hypothetical protein
MPASSGGGSRAVSHGSDGGPDDFYSAHDMRSPTCVGIGYEIRQVKDVDCVAQKFFADFSLIMKWFDERVQRGDVAVEDVEQPPYYIGNSVNCEERDCDMTQDPADPPGVVTMNVSFAGELSEFMELEMFPLDCQDLTILVRMKEKGWKFKILNPDLQMERIRDSVEMAEWRVHHPNRQVSVGKQGRAFYELKMVVSRKADFYVYNVMFMVGGITTLALFAFLFKADAWDKRSNYIGMLLLTTVAFKFVVADSLPKVSFFTVLDIYMFGNFIVMLFLIIQAAAVKFVIASEIMSLADGTKIDVIFAIGVYIIWIILNIIFFRRFFALDQENVHRLGPPLAHIATNQDTKGALGYILTGDLGDSDGDE